MKAVEGVKYLGGLNEWLNGTALLNVVSSNIKYVVEKFLERRGHLYQQPSWRAVIFSLDGAVETHLADRIRHYAEPVHGR